MIKAYHQVGTDEMEPEEYSKLLAHVMEIGEIVPASRRIARREMEEECFGKRQGIRLRDRFRRSTPEAIGAMEKIAWKAVSELPEQGTSHTMFNCVDVLAGDLDRVFLSVKDWYAIPNGLVFDAEQLLSMGAAFRPQDALTAVSRELEHLSKKEFDDEEEALSEIQESIREVVDFSSLYGHEARRALKQCLKIGKGECPGGEIVWDGRLPVDLAVEIWDDGKRIG